MRVLNEKIHALKIKNKVTDEVIFSILEDEIDIIKPYYVEVTYEDDIRLDFDYKEKKIKEQKVRS